MRILQANLEKDASILFALDNKAFNRDFDFPSRNITEQIQYLKDCEVYILYELNEPIGFFAYKMHDDYLEIKSLAIIPEKQGKGFGKALMKKLFNSTTNVTIKLVTHPKNNRAIIFYLEFGFQIYGWKDNYYGDGEPRLLLHYNR